MERGIISSPTALHISPNGVKRGKPLSLDDLRYYSLYWDRLVIPTAGDIHELVPQEECFISSGVLERPISSKYNNKIIRMDSNIVLDMQSEVAEQYMKDKNTDWVVCQPSSDILLPDQYSVNRNTLRIDLSNCLPVPTGNVNVHDILEFKLRRRNEFIAMHEQLDALYEQALLSPDQSLSSKKAISNLKETIKNLDKVTQENFKLFTKRNLSTLFNLFGKELGKGLVIDLVSASLTGTALPVATVSNVINTTIQIGIQPSQIFKPAEKNLKLAYLTSASKEGLM